MKTIAIIGFLVLAMASTPAQTTKDSLEILRLESVWNNAHLASDAAALDSLWADEFQVFVPGMRTMNKSDVLEFVRSGRMKFQRYETSGTLVSVSADSAIVSGVVFRLRIMKDQSVEDRWRFTKRLVRRSDRWRVVSWSAEPAL